VLSIADRSIGVILAAGRGRRMGRTKQLVAWPVEGGAKPLVAAAFDTISSACIEMIVVLGHERDAVAGALAPRLFHSVVSNPDAPLFDSIRAGLAAATRLDPAATVVLQPGDHPRVAPETLAALAAAARANPDQAILPEFCGRGGHPVFIPPALVARLLVEDCPHGLGRFWTDYPQSCCRVAVDDPTVVEDIDTPEHLD
jgi:CTP:molybdopterin cytidylyltransferase MocA